MLSVNAATSGYDDSEMLRFVPLRSIDRVSPSTMSVSGFGLIVRRSSRDGAV